jgi:hypothetical protein
MFIGLDLAAAKSATFLQRPGAVSDHLHKQSDEIDELDDRTAARKPEPY